MKFYLFVREFGVFYFGSLTYFRSGVWRKITHNLRNNKKENSVLSIEKSLYLHLLLLNLRMEKHVKPIKSITL